jgi:hypothetical protein
MESLELSPEELCRIWGNAIVFVQVAAAKHGVRGNLLCPANDPCQRVAQRLPTPPAKARIAPSEGRVQMNIGEENVLHRARLSKVRESVRHRLSLLGCPTRPCVPAPNRPNYLRRISLRAPPDRVLDILDDRLRQRT